MKGGPNLERIETDLGSPATLRKWLQLYDRVASGEMPPVDESVLSDEDRHDFLELLAGPLTEADKLRISREGRSPIRRLNRHEYENTLRHILRAPWLSVVDQLPVDGVAHHFSKSAECLPVSHVHLSEYLKVAEAAVRLAVNTAAHPTQTIKSYAREEPTFDNYLRYRFGQKAATRSIMPLDGFQAEPDVIRGKQPLTVGNSNPGKRERESMGVFSGTYAATTKYDFKRNRVPFDGLYRIRMKAYSFQAGPNGASGGDDHGLTGGRRNWWRPDRNTALRSERTEPVTLYALAENGESRWLVTFDAQPEPSVFECVVSLRQREGIRPDAARLVRTRPGWKGNPNATRSGIPGLAINWLEWEGPLHEERTPASYQAVFGNLPFDVSRKQVRALSKLPRADARRLLSQFLRQARRRPLESDAEVQPFLHVFDEATNLGADFTDAMIAASAAILVSPEVLFLHLDTKEFDEHDLATRLAYFLWNSPPDDELAVAFQDGGRSAFVGETRRLLNSDHSERFIHHFLDYWLELRDVNANAPDAELYPDYYLDELLTESSVRETRLFFQDLVENDLPARYLVDADFTYLNERLAKHYGLPAVEGVNPIRTRLPTDSVRGGLLTQASILRVTANGTTTSPVLRGVWVMERLLGVDIPPPPSGVAAIEPDIRGAKTIRDQLEKHRSIESCRACHRKFDPAGFALENFDVAGGWRDRYRNVGQRGDPVEGIGKNGHLFAFRLANTVECGGELAGFGEFEDIRELKRLFVDRERQLARNLVHQIIVYATGSPVLFSERAEVERILDRAKESQYGVRTLIELVVQSSMFSTR